VTAINYRYIVALLIGFLLLPWVLSAQTDAQQMKPGQIKKYAKLAAESGDIFTAIDFYEIFLKERPGNIKALHELGNLYYREKNYVKAADCLRKSFKGNRDKYILDQYYYAMALKTMGEYLDAEQQFQIFQRYLKKDKLKDTYGKMAKIHIESFKLIPELQKPTQNIVITHLDSAVNKPHIEFSPIPTEDGKLIYASLKQDKLEYYDPITQKLPVRKFYMAYEKNGKWVNLGEFDKTINGENQNTGNGAFAVNGNKFYFTRCEKSEQNKVICKIFYSVSLHNEWQAPIELGEQINMPFFTSTMPAVGVSKRNTDILYFVSDRPDGRGGLDIWFTAYNDRKNEYETPKNCGKNINTLGNEITPYYNIDTKTLYFSSDLHPGLGGYDVFKSSGEGKQWTAAENLGIGINSSFDDLYYTLTPNRQKGYFVSNRKGTQSIRHENCCDDIFEFVYSDFIVIGVTGQVFGITDSTFFKSIEHDYKEDLHLNIEDVSHNNAIEVLYNYPVSLFMKDKNTGKDLFIKTDSTRNGNYFFNLEQGIDYYITVKDFNRVEKRIDFTTKPITSSDTLVLDAIIVNTIPNQPFVVNNIYYEFGLARLTDKAKTTIDNTIYSLMTKYPQIIVEIRSHTDSVASDEFNMKLSQDRAQSVVDYLIEKGISRDRLVATGFGEAFPIAPNTNPDGTDNPDGRAKNRRTEFRIIGAIEDYSDILYED